MSDTLERLRESYREALEDASGYDACVRLGARFENVIPALLDIAEAAQGLVNEFGFDGPAFTPLLAALAALDSTGGAER